MYVGQGVARTDGRLKVCGQAAYAGDFQLDGMAHAVLVQSTVPAGTVTGFELDEAHAMPGVIVVVTPENAERLHVGKAAPQTVTAPLLQDMAVRFNGQHVAIVVADTLERAMDAASKVRVQYGALNAVTRMDPRSGDVAVPKSFNKGPPDSSVGDPDGAFAAAPVRIEAIYETPVEHHNAMEPHATLARWDGDKLTVWTATQGIGGAHKTLAALFGLEPEQVDVICPYVGGGFGSKGNAWPPAALAAMAARAARRPVRLVLARQQMYTSNGYRPATIQTVKLGAAADGALQAVRHDGFAQTSRPELGEFAEPFAIATRSLYACPNIGTSHRVVRVSQGLPTYMRAPGEAPGVFAIESAMDELAAKLGMDPLALRLKNHADKDWTEDKPFASKALRECYAQGAAAFGWDRRAPAPRSMRDGRTLVGWGMATSTYPTNRSPASARVRLLPDGTAVVQSGTQDLGTGTYTVMTQVAADALGLPMERVRAELGDSRLPAAPVSGGSQTVASVMPAVQAAAKAARDKAFASAIAHGGDAWSGLSPADLTLEPGAVSGPRGRVSLSELTAAEGLDAIEAEATTKPPEDAKRYAAHAFGAQFCEVRVDADLGTIRVARWVGAFDAGRVMNARTGRSQLIGGITYGIGQALMEETRVDAPSGRYTNANLSEYLVPVNADVPDIQAFSVESGDPVSDPFGAKGMGELPMVGTAPAIANAVFHATGRRVRRLPIRVEDVLA